MSSSLKAYKELIDDVYKNKVLNCKDCQGLNPSCHCMTYFEKIAAIANARIPYKFRYASLDKFVMKQDFEEIQNVEKYMRHLKTMYEQGMGMWISGKLKTGKSLIICSVLVQAIEQGYSAYYLEVNDFYRLQEIRYSEDTSKYQKKMKVLYDVDFLAIDGLGLGISGGKPAGKLALAHMFQQRIDAKKPTIIGSLAKEIENMEAISQEFASLIPEGCPIIVTLMNEGFVQEESRKKRSFFEKLP